MSPLELRVPLITMSALMIDGADRTLVRLDRGTGAGAIICCGTGAVSLVLLENMAASLEEIVGVFYDVVIPNFVMDMRSGAASGRTNSTQTLAFGDPGSHAHDNRGKMTIACAHTVAMIVFHHIAIAAAIAREHNNAWCGSIDH